MKLKLAQALFELGRSQLLLHMGPNWPDILMQVRSADSCEERDLLLSEKVHKQVLIGSSQLDIELKQCLSIRRELYGEKSVEVAEVYHLDALAHIRQLFDSHFINDVSLNSPVCKQTRKLAEERLIVALGILDGVAENDSPDHPTWRFEKALVFRELFALDVIWENYDKARDRCHLALATLEPIASEENGKQFKQRFGLFLHFLNAMAENGTFDNLFDTILTGSR